MPDINTYIQQEWQKGIPDDQIRQNLLGGGWPEDQVNQAFTGMVIQATPLATNAKATILSRLGRASA